MAEIYENSPLYLLGKRYVAWSFKQYYKEVIIIGKENILTNEAVIFAPNHLNALMDALAVLTLPPLDQVKVYLARADLFSLPPAIQKFLTFAKLMPAYRIRDGYENLGKNKESFDLSTKVLLNQRALCIMPEGNQGEERKIRPLVKGIFRIAFDAQMQMPEDKSVHIIPIGIEMNEWINPGGHLIMNIGKPIRVADYMLTYAENSAKAINQIKDDLKKSLDKLIINYDSVEYYDIYEVVIQILTPDYLNREKLENNTLNRFFSAQKIAKKLVDLEKEEPEKIKMLAEKVRELQTILKKHQIEAKYSGVMHSVSNTFHNNSLIALLSIASIPGIIFNILPVKVIKSIPAWMKIKFEGFFSSVYYGSSILLFPIFYVLQAALLVLVFNLSWWYFIPLIISYFVTGKIANRSMEKIKELIHQNKLKKLKKENIDSKIKAIKDTTIFHYGIKNRRISL